LLAQAVRYAVDHGVGVITLSYSVKRRSMLIDKILTEVTAASPGAVTAAAAGNSGGTDPEYPAAEGVPGLLVVAASTKSDKLASFSTRGSWVQVAAPGDRIVSSVPGGQYAAWSGTSMAAPLTAGTVALVRAAYPNLSPAKVAEAAPDIAGADGRRIGGARQRGPQPTRRMALEDLLDRVFGRGDRHIFSHESEAVHRDLTMCLALSRDRAGYNAWRLQRWEREGRSSSLTFSWWLRCGRVPSGRGTTTTRKNYLSIMACCR